MPKAEKKPVPESYSEMFIGECIVGDCGRPATVRVHANFVLCVHHHEHHIGECEDEMNLAAQLMRGWRSQADHHGNEYLVRLFDAALIECRERLDTFEEMSADADQTDKESIPNERIRIGMNGNRPPES